MAIKKSQLYTKLWQACDELRGGMDASQYKDYVLVVLFIKYISDRAKNGDADLYIDLPRSVAPALNRESHRVPRSLSRYARR